jgi:hypothetical protein
MSWVRLRYIHASIVMNKGQGQVFGVENHEAAWVFSSSAVELSIRSDSSNPTKTYSANYNPGNRAYHKIYNSFRLTRRLKRLLLSGKESVSN